MVENRVTAVDLEALNSGAATSRVTAVDVEALNPGAAVNRVTAVDIEILVPLHPIIYLSQPRKRRPELRPYEDFGQRSRRFASLPRPPPTSTLPFTYLLLAGL